MLSKNLFHHTGYATMRKELYVLSAFVLMLTAPAAAFAQQQIPPREPLRLTVDCARFRGPDDTTAQVEVYYSFPQAALTYSLDSARYKGALDIVLTAKLKDSVVYGAHWLAPHPI